MAKLPKRSNLHRPRNTADHASATDAAAHSAHAAAHTAHTAHSAHAAEPSTGYTENRVSGKRVHPIKIQMGIPKTVGCYITFVAPSRGHERKENRLQLNVSDTSKKFGLTL